MKLKPYQGNEANDHIKPNGQNIRGQTKAIQIPTATGKIYEAKQRPYKAQRAKYTRPNKGHTKPNGKNIRGQTKAIQSPKGKIYEAKLRPDQDN